VEGCCCLRVLGLALRLFCFNCGPADRCKHRAGNDFSHACASMQNKGINSNLNK
jgi:hypothetical protein